MTRYTFSLNRSTDPSDQVDGINCSNATAEGDFEETSDDQAKAMAMGFACLPGRWIGHVQRSGRFMGLNFRKEPTFATSEADR